mmetsp:Transcript_54376/g.126892  ORF Transcript_54376/g.126892 Transcript_54376/m.126892 type:complete len:629 (-) Transcript_54376:107-1993(-)
MWLATERGRRLQLLVRLFLIACLLDPVSAVKEVATYKEFQDLFKEAGARPVILDFYSQTCGPCHMIAPVFNKISKEYAGRAYFRKVDVNRNSHTAQAQGIRGMPTFQFWIKGKKVHQFSGADEHSLREWTKKLVIQADAEDIEVTREALETFYLKHDPQKASKESIDNIMKKNEKDWANMVRLLRKKYGEGPVTQKPVKRSADKKEDEKQGASLQTASLEELQQELARRQEELAEKNAELEETRLANNPCSLYRNRTRSALQATEKVVIIGGGPAGMSAAIYAARANLCPLVIAPALGGQLMAKGVDVENYPGLPRENGGRIIDIMKAQARSFFAEVWDDTVVSLNSSSQPFEIVTNNSGIVLSHTVILATGADSRWLGSDGEYEYRGHGVSSCAACDGYLFKGRPCAVIGGGDTAMEEALMLSRICSGITLIHRRDEFRASKVLQDRVLNNPRIKVLWNTKVARFAGKEEVVDGEVRKSLTHLDLEETAASSASTITQLHVDAAFVAIGHNPNTQLVKEQLEMDSSGFLHVQQRSTRTSIAGIFAAGDVADHTYQQAITSGGSGAMAALDAERYLSETDIEEDSCVRQEDYSTWSMKELRDQVSLLGLKCLACSEKEDFISSLRAAY